MKRPGPLAILFVIVFVDLLGFGMVVPLIPLYARHLGGPEAHVGLISTGYSAMQFVFAPIWGRVSDRIGRRPVLLWSIAMTGVAFALSGAAASFAWLLVARLFAGAATANISIAQAYVADVTSPQDRARGMGAIGAAFGLGFVFGPFFGGELSRLSLGAPFYAAAALALANGVAAWFILPEPHLHRAVPTRGRLDVFREAMRRPGLRRLLVSYLLVITAFSAMENTFAFLAKDHYGLTFRGVGHVFAFIGLVMVIVQGRLVGPLARRFGERALWIWGTGLIAIAIAALPFLPGTVGLVVACVPLAVGHGLAQPSVSALLSRASAREHQGSSLGLAQSSAALGRIVGPEAGTIAYHGHPAWPYLGGALLSAAASVVGFGLAPMAVKERAAGEKLEEGAAKRYPSVDA